MILAIIPARYESSRFPGKPLVDIRGTSMVMRVYQQCRKASLVDEVAVATDDHRILEHVQEHGGKAFMTRKEHRSGTDRCAELCEIFPDASHILNVQGDEPFIQPEQIDLLVQTLKNNKPHIATLAKKITSEDQLFNSNVVKVVFGKSGQALYFSRNPIPFLRDVRQEEWIELGQHYKHIGLYGFNRKALLEVAGLEPDLLEKNESLEQLRWLSNGLPIQVGITAMETAGIDTPEDLKSIL